jgi:serine/threonine protein kinase
MAEDPQEYPPEETEQAPEEAGMAEPPVNEEGVESDEGVEAGVAEILPMAEVSSPDATDALLQPCTNCASLLDVGDLEPFAKVHCPICGTAIRARTQLKNFTLVEVLGAGGMGAVYKALDTHLDRMVALKVVRKEYSADAEYLAKFEREARITASVNHPHVVKVYSFGSDHGLFYIAMELVDKGSLDDLMNLQGRVAEIQALGVGIQVAQGLEAAHQKGLIHRDVKPGNILFAGAKTAKIVDFGLALLAEHEAEERGEVWGTPYYVAPEKLDHLPEDFRSDMYSLGGTLFHAIAGRPPFEADTASTVALKHLKSKAVSLQAFAPDVTSATAYVINRTLSKDPDQRYQSYAELIEHLEYARGQLLANAEGPRRPKQRVVVEGAATQKVGAIITLLLILAVIGGAIWVYSHRASIFSLGSAATTPPPDPQALAKREQADFDKARKQIADWDTDGAVESLRDLDDEIPAQQQPIENWVRLHRGLVSIMNGNRSDADGWFKQVSDSAHFSNDLADSTLVNFFTKVSGGMTSRQPIKASEGSQYASDSVEALAPFLFALKDWDMGRFTDAGKMFQQYLSSNPKDPFQWVADYKPVAKKYADDEGMYEKVSDAAASADTPEKRADALNQAQQLQAQMKGRLADRLNRLADEIRKKSAQLDPAYYAQINAAKQRDQQALAQAAAQYKALCADFRFDDAKAVAGAVAVSGSDGIQQKQAMLKKADWLRQFKTQLIQDINARGIASTLFNRAGGALPDGRKQANDAGLNIQTQFGPVPVAWNMLTVSDLLGMANQFIGSLANSAPQQAADREWLAGVFACEEGMPNQGSNLLQQAAQLNDDYKQSLSLFPEAQPAGGGN